MASRPAQTSELKDWLRRFREWNDPTTFGQIVAKMNTAHGDHCVTQPGSSFREAFLAHRLALHLRADGVRLGDDPPDFELQFGKEKFYYEAAEVLEPGRRRGDEFKADRLLSPEEQTEPELWPEVGISPSDALKQLRSVAEQKARKGYPNHYGLILFVNMEPIFRESRFVDGITAALSLSLEKFSEVWILRVDGTLVRHRKSAS